MALKDLYRAVKQLEREGVDLGDRASSAEIRMDAIDRGIWKGRTVSQEDREKITRSSKSPEKRKDRQQQYQEQQSKARELEEKRKNAITDLALNRVRYGDAAVGPDALNYVQQLTDELEALRGQMREYETGKNGYRKKNDDDAYFSRQAGQEAYKAAMAVDLEALETEIGELRTARDRYAENQEVDWTDNNQRVAYEQYLDEQDKLISDKERELAYARHIQGREAYDDVADPESDAYDLAFDKLRQYVSTEKKDAQWWENPVQDTQYEWINNQDEFRDQYEQGMKDMTTRAGGQYSSEYLEKGYDHLTQDEINIYNYYYAKEGKEKAQEYLDSIQETLNYRMAEKTFGGLEDNTALELLFGVNAGLDQFKSGVSNFISTLTNTEESYIPQSHIQMASQMVRNDLDDDGFRLPEWMGGGSLGQAGYDVITSASNMAPSILVSMGMNIIAPGSGQYVGTALMGMSAAGGAYQEALNNGYSKDQARAYSWLVGASEAVLGNVLGGISSLGGKLSNNVAAQFLSKVDNAFLRAAGKLGANMFSEFSEEYLQEVLTPVFSNLALGTDEEIRLISSEAIYAGFLGALTAGVMEGSGVVGGEVSTYRTGRQLQNAGITADHLAEIGQTMAADTVAYQLAGRVDENTGAYTLGRLFHEIDAEVTQQNVVEIQSALEAKGMPEKIARSNAEVFAAVAAGAELSEAQQKIVESNEVLSQVVQDVIINQNSTVYQRSQGYQQVLKTLAKEMTTPEISRRAQSQPEAVEAPVQETLLYQENEATETLPEADTSTDEEGLIRETVAGLGANETASKLLTDAFYTSDQVSAETYAQGIEEAYRYGQYNYPMQELANAPFASQLTAHQQKVAYKMGQMFGGKQIARQQAVAKKATAKKSSAVGTVHYDGDRNTLTERQQASLSGMETVAKALGVQIYVFESKVGEDGKRTGTNGWYDPENSSIHIDLYAGANGEATMLFTLSHELTHFIRQWSPAKFKELSNFLMREYGRKGVSVEALVHAQMAKAKRDGREISFDTTWEEVVADSMETMLTDGSVVEKLAKLKQQDKSLWEKIKGYIQEVTEKIRKAYEGLRPDSAEGRYVAEMIDSIERIRELFAEGLVEAGKNYQTAGASENTASDGNEKLYSLREFGDGVRFVDVQMDPHIFDGMSVADMNRVAKDILTKKFAGRVIGIEHRAFVNGDSINEYLHPSKSIDLDTRKAKLTASGELDNLLDAGTALPNKPDGADGHIHPDAIDFSYFKTIFKVGNEYFEGIVNIKNIKRGKLLKDVTKIKNITQDIVSSYGQNPKSNFLRDASMDSIRNSQGNVNQKFSARDPSVQRMNEALEKENAKLKEDVEYLKQMLNLQRSVTGGTKFTRSSVESMAGILMKQVNAKGERRELGKLLNELYEFIAQSKELTWEEVQEKAQPAVDWLRDRAAPQVHVNEYANDILREIRTSRVYLDDMQKQEAASLYGSYHDFRRAMMGSIVISESNSESLDSRWNELAAQYPSIFDPDVSSADMPRALADAVDSLRGMRTTEEWYDRYMSDAELMREVYDGFWKVSTMYTVADVKQKEINNLKFQHTERMEKLRSNHKENIAKLKQEHREEIQKIRKEYRQKAETKQAETLREQREMKAVLRGQKNDAAVMEQEFIRLVKQYEQQSKASEQQIDVLEAKLKQEARKHDRDAKVWEREFDRLLTEYERADRKIDKLTAKIEKQKKTAADKVDSRKRAELRHKIQKKVDELNRLLLNGTKERHVPENLRNAVASILNAVNMEVANTDQRKASFEAHLAQYDRRIARENDPEKIRKLIEQRKAYEEKGDQFQAKMKALHDAYEEIKNDDDPLLSNAYDEGLSAHLMSLIVEVGDTPLGKMNRNQLECVYDVCQIVLTTISNANKTFKAARNATIAELGTNVMREVKLAGGKKGHSPAALESIKKFGWNNLKPVYAFEMIGSKTFREIFQEVRAGEDMWARDVTEAREFYLDKVRKHGFDKWDMEKRYDFTSTSGLDFGLNLEQIMSLYAYSKREQAADHLRKGGIVIDESTEVTMKTKFGFKMKFNPTEATAYNLSDDILAEIISKLTPAQKAFVDEMQEYLSSSMGNKGNEVSLQMYGIRLFKEQNYFPLRSASQFMAKAKEQQQGEVKLKNSGFSKGTVKHASNPVVLTPFTKVWAGHVNEMSMYHSFVLPMEDFYRVYNFKTPTSDLSATESVEMHLQNAYGKGATQYLDRLLKDLNGGVLTDSTTGFINTMMGKFKKGAVFASASVVIQQPSAIARAAALVDPKYFVGRRMDSKGHKYLWEQVKQYAPVAIIKEMGYFDTNMGKSAEDFLLGKEYSGIIEKAKALVTDEEFRDEILSKAPALADEMAWCSIWQAVKRETEVKYPKMDIKSEAFLKLTGERFTEVIIKTQVYDSVLSRSANMRSKDTGMKMATAFMAEPTTAINMIADGLSKGTQGTTEGRRYCRRTVGAVVAAQILNAFLVSWVYAGRDDDEEKSFGEKYTSSFVGSIVDGINLLTYLPFIRDIISIVSGYDVERSDMAVISDLWNAWKQLGSDKATPWKKVEEFAGSICQMLGLPLKNIMRDVRAAYQTYDTIINGEDGTTQGMYYAAQEGATGKTVSNAQQLYEARLAGDEEHAVRVAARYKDEDAANSAVRSAIREGFLGDGIEEETAIDHLVKYTGMDKYDAFWKVDEWKYQKVNGTSDGYGKYNRFYKAVRSGENLQEIIRHYIDHGVEESTLRSQITSHFKPMYLEADAQSRAAIRGYVEQAMRLCGSNSWDVEKTMSEWDFAVQHDGNSYDELVAAYKAGEYSANGMKQILTKEKGYAEEDADRKLKELDFEVKYGFSYSEREKAYKDGLISASDLRKTLIEIGGKTEAEADKLMDAMNYLKKNPQYNATASEVVSWQKKLEGLDMSVENTGMKLDVFLAERKVVNKFESDKDENGNGIAYSRIKKAFPYINSLDLTPTQKTALAVACGWELRTVERNKLW